ncbi:MAG: 2,4-dihydroxyhept-2-ene-1,7-dioic acid aldolase [Veillonella sp.]|nr:2,4-dihydroxyhept-2-ene-1,7-dioic acid aldolase [Veillonella sp.]
MAMTQDFLKNQLVANIKEGKVSYGVALEMPSVDVAEVLATADFDWMFIDGEHGAHTLESIVNVARTILPYGVTPVVRTPEKSNGMVKQLLDSGINNIIFPKVETAEEAEEIMTWASYPGRGTRGMGAIATRAGLYGRIADYAERIDQESLMMIQIESKKGIENFDAIAKVPGLKTIFLGPIDIAMDMGHGLNIFHPEVTEAMHYLIKRAQEHGLSVGTIALTPEQAKEYIDLGVSYISVGLDTQFLVAGADAALKTFKG